MQSYDSTMCGKTFCIGFVDFILKGKSLLQYTNFFSAIDYEKNGNIILTYFETKLNKLKCILMFVISTEKLRKTKISYIFKKTLSLFIVYSTCGHEYITKIFEEEESIEILKILGVINDIKEYHKIYNHGWRKHKPKI